MKKTTTKYVGKLDKAAYGTNSTSSRRYVIDVMAGVIPDTLSDIPKYEWRGMNKSTDSMCDKDYKMRGSKMFWTKADIKGDK